MVTRSLVGTFAIVSHTHRDLGVDMSAEHRLTISDVPNHLTAILVPLGRLLFASIFLYYGPLNFTQGNVNLAIRAGMPMPDILVPIGGVLALAGALSVVLGVRARIGGVLLVLFLVPTLVIMHAFWRVEGPQAQAQLGNFLRNLSLLGGALLICHFGAGPYSFDNGIRR
jgi:putative oxidoreductase